MLMFVYTYCHLTDSIAIILLVGNSFSNGNFNNYGKDFCNSVFSSAFIFHLVRCQCNLL